MQTATRLSGSGMLLIAGSLVWVVAIFVEYTFGLFPPRTGTLYDVNQAMFFVAMAGYVAGIVGLIREHASGDGWFGRVAVGLFAFGWFVLMVATPIQVVTGDNNLPLFPIGGLTSMLGGILAGIAVVVAHQWHGWRRFSVLFYALFYFLVLMLPLLVVGRTPSEVTEVLWGLAWLPMGYALLTASQTRRQEPGLRS